MKIRGGGDYGTLDPLFDAHNQYRPAMSSGQWRPTLAVSPGTNRPRATPHILPVIVIKW